MSVMTFRNLLLLALLGAFLGGAGGGFLLGHRSGLAARGTRALCTDATRRDTVVWLSDNFNVCHDRDRGMGLTIQRQHADPVAYLSWIALSHGRCLAEWRWTPRPIDRVIGVSWEASSDRCIQSQAPPPPELTE